MTNHISLLTFYAEMAVLVGERKTLYFFSLDLSKAFNGITESVGRDL